MELKALVLIGGGEAGEGRFAKTPLVLAEVLGRPAVHHLVSHLTRQNVSEVVVVSEYAAPPHSGRRFGEPSRCVVAPAGQLWRTAENAFNDLAQSGAEEVLVVRMGAYVEPDVEDLLQAHMDNRSHATRAVDANGEPMDLLVLTASRRNDAAYLFRHALRETRTRCGNWRFRGYSNALQTAHNLRCLAVDAFLGENGIVPAGTEVRPGVWMARGASVHPRARLLAPAFIGEGTRIRANAVVTRCSVVERNCDVGMGTVVEDTSVLPYTRLGSGLDFMHAVAGNGRMVSVEHDVDIEIADSRLMSELPRRAGTRALAHAAALFSFVLPPQLSRRIVRTARASNADLPEAVTSPSALETPAGFPAASGAMHVTSRSWQ